VQECALARNGRRVLVEIPPRVLGGIPWMGLVGTCPRVLVRIPRMALVGTCPRVLWKVCRIAGRGGRTAPESQYRDSQYRDRQD